jgi:hypothetical protein
VLKLFLKNKQEFFGEQKEKINGTMQSILRQGKEEDYSSSEKHKEGQYGVQNQSRGKESG